MSNLHNSIGHFQSGSQNPIRAEEIGANKQSKEELSLELLDSKRLWTISWLMAQKIVDELNAVESPKELSFLINELKAFIKDLYLLKGADLSSDWRFCESLSSHFKKLTESIEGYPNLLPQLKDFIAMIDKYPESEPHSLGYYLSLNAGAEWIPFPFMEILHRLHISSQEIEHLLQKGDALIRTLS